MKNQREPPEMKKHRHQNRKPTASACGGGDARPHPELCLSEGKSRLSGAHACMDLREAQGTTFRLQSWAHPGSFLRAESNRKPERPAERTACLCRESQEPGPSDSDRGGTSRQPRELHQPRRCPGASAVPPASRLRCAATVRAREGFCCSKS